MSVGRASKRQLKLGFFLNQKTMIVREASGASDIFRFPSQCECNELGLDDLSKLTSLTCCIRFISNVRLSGQWSSSKYLVKIKLRVETHFNTTYK